MERGCGSEQISVVEKDRVSKIIINVCFGNKTEINVNVFSLKRGLFRGVGGGSEIS